MQWIRRGLRESSDCKIVPNLGNPNHTVNETDSDLSDQTCQKKNKKFKKKQQKDKSESGDSSDSSVIITDVKLTNEFDIDKWLNKPAEDLDTQQLWDRLVFQQEQDEDESSDDKK